VTHASLRFAKFVELHFELANGEFTPNIFFYNTTAESFNIKKLYRRLLSMNKSVLCAKTAKWRF